MQLPSLEVLASWPAPNYVDPETRGNAVLIVNVILFPVALLIVLIRLYTRLQISKSFGLDDWLIAAAMLPSTTFAVLAILAEEAFQFNRHVWDLPTSQVTFGLQYVMITQIVFTLAQTLTKCSMLALIYRILSNGKRFKIFTIAATVIIAVQGMIYILVVIFQCRRPIPKILKLKISRRQRLVVILLFAAGFLVCVAGAIGASIPATKPFFKRYIPFLLNPSLSSSRNNHYIISSADKGPFSGSNTNTNVTPRTSRTSRTLSQVDVEMGEIHNREMRTKRSSRNLDAIEEVGGSDTSISSFVNIGGEGERERKSDDSEGEVMGMGMRDGAVSPRSGDTFDYRRTSKDELIDEVDVGVAIPYKAHLPRFSR
ncbi:hypothetical protein SBOR_8749 [Sclerotinia borealis F-4128]|uniref:Rhodopsin domain-containing protein n=1 Tax=Sclerotinia borealis (strain F-4128) TaxID=1432307 RepID=W9C259_SCLBF|nr:hypothetical protein SBOR_8749 [Sclerotinia borealis F-4128]